MKQEILQAIKNDYLAKMKTKTNTIELLKKIEELEQNEIVKEYLNLTEQLKSIDYQEIIGRSNEDIMESAFRNHMYSIKETNGIYVCLGTFMMNNTYDIEHGPSDYRLKRDDPRAEYRIYKDIEKTDSIQIPINKCEKFESTHKVIIPKTSLTEKYYYELQREFIKTAVKHDQEKACQRVLRKKEQH